MWCHPGGDWHPEWGRYIDPNGTIHIKWRTSLRCRSTAPCHCSTCPVWRPWPTKWPLSKSRESDSRPTLVWREISRKWHRSHLMIWCQEKEQLGDYFDLTNSLRTMKETNDSCVEISCKSQKIHQTSKKTQPQNCSYTVDIFFFSTTSLPKKNLLMEYTKNTTPLHLKNLSSSSSFPSLLPTPSPSSRAVPSRPVGNTLVGT